MEVFDYELNSYLQSLYDSDRISDMIDRIEGCVTTAAEIMATKNIDPDVLCPEDYPLFAQEAIEAHWGGNVNLSKLHDLDEEQLRTIDPPTRAEIEAAIVEAVSKYLISQGITE